MSGTDHGAKRNLREVFGHLFRLDLYRALEVYYYLLKDSRTPPPTPQQKN